MRILVVTANEDNRHSAECSLADHELTIVGHYQTAWSWFVSGRGRQFDLVMFDYSIWQQKAAESPNPELARRRQLTIFAQLVQMAVGGGVTKLVVITQSRKTLLPAANYIAKLCDGCSCENAYMYLIIFEPCDAKLSFMYAGQPYPGLPGFHWERAIAEFESHVMEWHEVYE